MRDDPSAEDVLDSFRRLLNPDLYPVAAADPPARAGPERLVLPPDRRIDPARDGELDGGGDAPLILTSPVDAPPLRLPPERRSDAPSPSATRAQRDAIRALIVEVLRDELAEDVARSVRAVVREEIRDVLSEGDPE